MAIFVIIRTGLIHYEKGKTQEGALQMNGCGVYIHGRLDMVGSKNCTFSKLLLVSPTSIFRRFHLWLIIKKGWPGQRLEHTNLLRNWHIIIIQYLLLI